jgi:N-methylhydantoinase A
MRRVYLPDARGYGDVPVYDRYALGAGATLDGPAVIEERESTVVVSAAARIRVDGASNVIVEVPPVA